MDNSERIDKINRLSKMVLPADYSDEYREMVRERNKDTFKAIKKVLRPALGVSHLIIGGKKLICPLKFIKI